MEEYCNLINSLKKDIWLRVGSKEFGRLSNGSSKCGTSGTQCIVWEQPRCLPKGKEVTYLRIVADYRDQKADPHQVRETVGGNRIINIGPTRTPTADVITFNILVNSVISTPGARFINLDIKDFYLNTKMKEPEYMLVIIKLFPPDIVKQYWLK